MTERRRICATPLRPAPAPGSILGRVEDLAAAVTKRAITDRFMALDKLPGFRTTSCEADRSTMLCFARMRTPYLHPPSWELAPSSRPVHTARDKALLAPLSRSRPAEAPDRPKTLPRLFPLAPRAVGGRAHDRSRGSLSTRGGCPAPSLAWWGITKPRSDGPSFSVPSSPSALALSSAPPADRRNRPADYLLQKLCARCA